MSPSSFRPIGFAGLLACAALVGLALWRPADVYADPLATMPLAWTGDGCDYHCRECPNDKHDIVVAVTNKHTANHLENCNPPAGCESHKCGATLTSRLTALWLAVRSSDALRIQALLRENPSFASYNTDRRSIQVRCEAGELVANIPLTSELSAALDE